MGKRLELNISGESFRLSAVVLVSTPGTEQVYNLKYVSLIFVMDNQICILIIVCIFVALTIWIKSSLELENGIDLSNIKINILSTWFSFRIQIEGSGEGGGVRVK